MVLGLSMSSWWSALSGTEQIFWGISIIFSVLFIIQFVISLIGLDFDGDVDASADGDVHADGYNLDPSFTILSVRSIIAFFTFFGWTGVLVLKSGGSLFAALGFSFISGLASMFVVGYMIYMFSRLSQDGSVNINDALYNTGEVYLAIPSNKKGQGKIHINIQGTLKEMDAISEGDSLPTGSSVRVVDIINNNVLVGRASRELFARRQIIEFSGTPKIKRNKNQFSINKNNRLWSL